MYERSKMRLVEAIWFYSYLTGGVKLAIHAGKNAPAFVFSSFIFLT
jgi:hypothetical protein